MHASPVESDELSTTWVARNYGGLVPAQDLWRLLGFRTATALRRAHETGRLALPLFRIEGRRGWFAHARDVSAYLRAQTGATTEGKP